MILDLLATVAFVGGTCGLMWLADKWAARDAAVDGRLRELERVSKFR
jgi:hypothetical protein